MNTKPRSEFPPEDIRRSNRFAEKVRILRRSPARKLLALAVLLVFAASVLSPTFNDELTRFLRGYANGLVELVVGTFANAGQVADRLYAPLVSISGVIWVIVLGIGAPIWFSVYCRKRLYSTGRH